MTLPLHSYYHLVHRINLFIFTKRGKKVAFAAFGCPLNLVVLLLKYLIEYPYGRECKL